MNGKMLSKTGPCPQLQVGETGTRGCLMMIPLKQAIGCLELSLAEIPKNENLLIAACHFWSNGPMPFFLAMGQCLPLWPMYT
jgi:hypothetical protein